MDEMSQLYNMVTADNNNNNNNNNNNFEYNYYCHYQLLLSSLTLSMLL